MVMLYPCMHAGKLGNSVHGNFYVAPTLQAILKYSVVKLNSRQVLSNMFNTLYYMLEAKGYLEFCCTGLCLLPEQLLYIATK